MASSVRGCWSGRSAALGPGGSGFVKPPWPRILGAGCRVIMRASLEEPGQIQVKGPLGAAIERGPPGPPRKNGGAQGRVHFLRWSHGNLAAAPAQGSLFRKADPVRFEASQTPTEQSENPFERLNTPALAGRRQTATPGRNRCERTIRRGEENKTDLHEPRAPVRGE